MKGAVPITALEDKFIGYMAVTPNRKFMRLFERANVQNILISYHYIKHDPIFTKDILQMVRDRGGLFMTDCGIFSFVNDKDFDGAKFGWQKYCEEYVEWLDQHKEWIFSACNLDADLFVRTDGILKWNEDYFEKLGQDINMIYVAHKNVRGRGDLDAFVEYSDKYNYVAINESLKHMTSAVYQRAKQKNVAVHGLAWTKPTILNDFPFFSVDSSTWVNYQKFGATPHWDGTNFNQHDKDNKDIRRTLKKKCDEYEVKFYEFQYEKDEQTGAHNDDEGLTFSLRTWLEVFQDLKKKAKTKLSIKIADMLDGKQTIFQESPLAVKPPKAASKLGAKLEGKENVGGELNHKVTYEEQDNGDLVPVYDKREKEEITAAVEKFGDALMCDNCHVSDKCPKMKQGANCGFNFSAAGMTDSPIATIDAIIAIQSERVNRAMFFEKMEGGLPNKTFTNELRILQELNNSKVNLLIAAQNKGVRITTLTITEGQPMLDDGTNNTPKSSGGGGGFAAMLQELMATPKK